MDKSIAQKVAKVFDSGIVSDREVVFNRDHTFNGVVHKKDSRAHFDRDGTVALMVSGAVDFVTACAVEELLAASEAGKSDKGKK